MSGAAITLVIWFSVRLISHAALDGKPTRRPNISFARELCFALLLFSVLYWGGFFGAV